MGKHQGEDVLEIPLNTLLTRVRKLWPLLVIFLGIAATDPPENSEPWPFAAPFLVVGALLIVGIARALLCRPVMRATSAGLWFGGGRIIPWREVDAIYDAWQPCKPFESRFQPPKLIIAFHPRRALLAAPWSLWFTSLPQGRIDIPLATLAEPTAAVVARLELMPTGARREERRHRANRKLRGARIIAP